MRILNKALLVVTVLFALSILIISIFYPSVLKNVELTTVVGALAVLAASISAWTSLRIIEKDEELKRPRVTLELDFNRYGLIQLSLKNVGQKSAHNIEFKWEKEPMDEGQTEVFPEKEIIHCLLPQESVLRNIGRGFELFKKKHTDFRGKVSYKDEKGKKYQDALIVDFTKYARMMDFTNESTKAYYELQKLPKLMEELIKVLKK